MTDLMTRNYAGLQALVDEYREWTDGQNLPCLSADELLLQPGLSASQVGYLEDFLTRWDAAVRFDAGAARRLQGALQWVVDDLRDAGEDKNPATGQIYDSVEYAQSVLSGIAPATGAATLDANVVSFLARFEAYEFGKEETESDPDWHDRLSETITNFTVEARSLLKGEKLEHRRYSCSDRGRQGGEHG